MTQLFGEYLRENDVKANCLTRDIIRAGGNCSTQAVRKWMDNTGRPSGENRVIVEKLLSVNLDDFPTRKQLRAAK